MLYVRRKSRGFTLVELLTVLAIITMLVGLLVPSLNMVRKIAKETKQKSQLASIEAALTTFRNDYGDYPPSNAWEYPPPPAPPEGIPTDYGGAQKLAEALLGWDLMGFHPDTKWDSVGSAYDPPNPSLANLYARRGRYLELETTNVFRLGNISPDKPGLFAPDPFTGRIGDLAPDPFVLCDVFGTVGKITIGGRTFKAGTPILYYKADTSSKVLDGATPADQRIYDYHDNQDVIGAADWADDEVFNHPLRDWNFLYDVYIVDPKVAATPWPYRPDSYLLITAGADGIYGSGDDICNFGN